jgi:hypothetical protein
VCEEVVVGRRELPWDSGTPVVAL